MHKGTSKGEQKYFLLKLIILPVFVQLCLFLCISLFGLNSFVSFSSDSISLFRSQDIVSGHTTKRERIKKKKKKKKKNTKRAPSTKRGLLSGDNAEYLFTFFFVKKTMGGIER